MLVQPEFTLFQVCKINQLIYKVYFHAIFDSFNHLKTEILMVLSNAVQKFHVLSWICSEKMIWGHVAGFFYETKKKITETSK